MSEETIFSKILKGTIPYTEIYSDEHCLAFKDIQPQAPIHILLIPRKAISSLRNAEEKDSELLGHLLLVSAKIANQQGIENWRTVINTGTDAGQTVFHLHLHIIGGRPLAWPPG